MEKQAVVTAVTGNGTWQSQYGLFYKFEVAFDNGDVGTYMTKEVNQNKFVVGQKASYLYEGKQAQNGQTYYSVKVPQPAQGGGGGGGFKKDPEESKRIVKQSSLKVAADLSINGQIRHEQILEYADIFTRWVYGENVVLPMRESDSPFNI
jgi:hypothetical protein